MSNGSGEYRIQSRAAAEGRDGGPAIRPRKGPTNRSDVLIGVAAVAAVVGAIGLLVALG